MENTVLRTENLCAFFGDQQILCDVNLSIPKNKATAIMGPSGCGKTTLIRCVNRMHELVPGAETTGRILLYDDDVQKMNPIIVRRKIGMVFQKPNPFPMTIAENVTYPLKVDGVRDKRVLAETVEKALKR